MSNWKDLYKAELKIDNYKVHNVFEIACMMVMDWFTANDDRVKPKGASNHGNIMFDFKDKIFKPVDNALVHFKLQYSGWYLPTTLFSSKDWWMNMVTDDKKKKNLLFKIENDAWIPKIADILQFTAFEAAQLLCEDEDRQAELFQTIADGIHGSLVQWMRLNKKTVLSQNGWAKEPKYIYDYLKEAVERIFDNVPIICEQVAVVSKDINQKLEFQKGWLNLFKQRDVPLVKYLSGHVSMASVSHYNEITGDNDILTQDQQSSMIFYDDYNSEAPLSMDILLSLGCVFVIWIISLVVSFLCGLGVVVNYKNIKRMISSNESKSSSGQYENKEPSIDGIL